MSHRNSRVAQIVAGLAVVSWGFAVAPMAAQAADTNATGTLSAGQLTNTAPVIAPFSTALTGITQTVTADVGAWSVNDATGSNEGYNITLSATAPTVDGIAADAGTDGSLTMGATTAAAAPGNSATTGPVSSSQLLSTTAATIDTAAAGTGQGQWNFAAADDNLSVVIPGDASAGAYSSTLTYTAAQPVV